MSQKKTADQALDLQALTGNRLGPYRSYNPASPAQVWQWCRRRAVPDFAGGGRDYRSGAAGGRQLYQRHELIHLPLAPFPEGLAQLGLEHLAGT